MEANISLLTQSVVSISSVEARFKPPATELGIIGYSYRLLTESCKAALILQWHLASSAKGAVIK